MTGEIPIFESRDQLDPFERTATRISDFEEIASGKILGGIFVEENEPVEKARIMKCNADDSELLEAATEYIAAFSLIGVNLGFVGVLTEEQAQARVEVMEKGLQVALGTFSRHELFLAQQARSVTIK